MSRSTRFDRLTFQHPRQTVKAALAAATRRMKRDLIAAGVLPDPSKRPPRHRWSWEAGVQGERVGGIVAADTRSQARALIKAQLRAKSSVGISLEKINNAT